MYFGDGVENAVVFDAYHNGHFAFAGDDADIHWVGNQRQMFATFFASKQSQIAKETELCVIDKEYPNSIRGNEHGKAQSAV